MKQYFKAHSFGEEAARLLGECNRVVERYQAKNLKLTLRQLYYQLVSRNLIPNEERAYKRISALLSNGRLMGQVDWEAIEDRIRVPRIPPEFKDLDDLVETALWNYRLDRWEGQENYVELWVEKDALAGILAPIANEYHSALMVNRGYSSQSAMFDAGQRYLEACYGGALKYGNFAEYAGIKAGKDFKEEDVRRLRKIRVLDPEEIPDPKRRPILLYLGDMDPSGEDMVRDIRERLQMFGVVHIDVRKIALTMEQIEEHQPPPNPAKRTDPRAAEYIEKFGSTSWEVDALPPEVLDELVRSEFEVLIDMEKMDAVKAREEKDKKVLRTAVSSILKKKGKKKK